MASAIGTAPAKDTGTGYVVFDHHPLEQMPSDFEPDPGRIDPDLSCALARGQYGCVQFGVRALDELTNIRVGVTSDVDVKIYRRRAAFTVPAAAQVTDADIDKRVAHPSDWMYLQPGDSVARLPPGTSVNFWLTIHADADTSPGARPGKVRIEIEGRDATELDLSIRVHPFQLAPARIPFGLWYARGQYTKGQDAAHEWIYRDIAAHGHNSVSFSVPRNFGSVDFTQVPLSADHEMVKVINTARDAGLVSPRFPCPLVSSILYNEYREGNTNLTDAQLDAVIDWLARQRREQGWPEIMVYGWDEPPVPAPGLRRFYTRLRPLPIRLGTAMSAAAAYAYGDIHDVWIVHDGHVTPEMQAEAARRGAQVWTYTYRLWRQGYDPLVQRHFAGLYTWALKLQGNYIWSYYYGYNWIEPDSKQTMPTTGWEARREGIDDHRYLQMVEDAIAAAPRTPTAREAAVWLEKLRAQVVSNCRQDADGYWDVQRGLSPSISRVEPHLVEAGKPFASHDYDRIRAAAADYIIKLGSAAPPQPAPAPRVRDEAAPFRGMSVQQCRAGLGATDATTRRAAAWALWELNTMARAAVPELIAALDDPQVRIPALMALAAIGPEAGVASARVAALLSHPDDFIRQGAAFTLQSFAHVPKQVFLEMPETWQFRKDPDRIGQSEQWHAPRTPKDAPHWSGISTHRFWVEGYVGDGWYALDLEIPSPEGKRVWLQFGSVDENYTLWLNGQYVADNLAAGTGLWNVSVEAEITGRFKPGKSNHVVVRVNNSAGAGGIWKPVRLLVEK